MTLDEAIKSLMALQAKLAAYGHAMGLLFYDGATTAPKGTAANRGQTMSILSEEHYKLTTGGETVALLEFLDAHKSELNEKQQRMVFLLIKIACRICLYRPATFLPCHHQAGWGSSRRRPAGRFGFMRCTRLLWPPASCWR